MIDIENEIKTQLKKLNPNYNAETEKLVNSVMIFIKAGDRNIKHYREGSMNIDGDIYYDVELDYKKNDHVYVYFKYNISTRKGTHKVLINL